MTWFFYALGAVLPMLALVTGTSRPLAAAYQIPGAGLAALLARVRVPRRTRAQLGLGVLIVIPFVVLLLIAAIVGLGTSGSWFGY